MFRPRPPFLEPRPRGQGQDSLGWLVFETAGGPVYFAGDTGFGLHFQKIYKRFGPMRLSLLPISPIGPSWFMRRIHMDPADAVSAHKILHSATSIGIHFGTFKQGGDDQDEPVKRLIQELKDSSVSPQSFRLPFHGKAVNIPPLKQQS